MRNTGHHSALAWEGVLEQTRLGAILLNHWKFCKPACVWQQWPNWFALWSPIQVSSWWEYRVEGQHSHGQEECIQWPRCSWNSSEIELGLILHRAQGIPSNEKYLEMFIFFVDWENQMVLSFLSSLAEHYDWKHCVKAPVVYLHQCCNWCSFCCAWGVQQLWLLLGRKLVHKRIYRSDFLEFYLLKLHFVDSYTSLLIHLPIYIFNCLVFVVLGNMCKHEVFRAAKQLM